jgi:hypothetical protein
MEGAETEHNLLFLFVSVSNISKSMFAKSDAAAYRDGLFVAIEQDIFGFVGMDDDFGSYTI